MDKGDTAHRENALGNEERDLIFLVPFALALRMLLYKWTYVIATDGRGLRELHQWLLQRVSSGRFGKIHITGTRGMAILTVMTVAIILPMSIHPQRAEKQGEKEAGLWIKNRSISDVAGVARSGLPGGKPSPIPGLKVGLSPYVRLNPSVCPRP